MASTPGITKGYVKSTGASKIARKEQDEIGWKNTVNGSREGNENIEIESKGDAWKVVLVERQQVVKSLALSLLCERSRVTGH